MTCTRDEHVGVGSYRVIPRDVIQLTMLEFSLKKSIFVDTGFVGIKNIAVETLEAKLSILKKNFFPLNVIIGKPPPLSIELMILDQSSGRNREKSECEESSVLFWIQ